MKLPIKIKRWIARKVGAVLFSDLGTDIKIEILYRMSQNAMDDAIKSSLLEHESSTHHVK